MKPIPSPLYGCCFGSCSEHISNPPSDLHWCEPLKGWVCDGCEGYVDQEYEPGITLEAYLATSPLSLIAAERRRQVEGLGYTAEKDDWRIGRQLAMKAAFYAIPEDEAINDEYERAVLWPGEYSDAPKADNRLIELTKAGALIVAEMERLMRKGEK